VDKDGDWVTITCRGDVQLALAEALKATDRRLGVIPPIRVTATPVDKVGTRLALCTRVAI
jgi:hypothetical protein